MHSSFFDPESFLEKGQSLLGNQVKAVTQSVAGQATGVKQHGTQDKATQDFIAEMYGSKASSDPTPQLQQAAQQGVNHAPVSDDQAKLAEARKKLEEHKKLHMETYYIPTFERRKQEERAAEKVEREEMEEKQKRWELQQEEAKKGPPIAVQMATNKAEQFRGAAG